MEVRRLTADCSVGHRWCYSYVNPFEIPLKLWKNENKLRNALKKIERARSDFMRNRIPVPGVSLQTPDVSDLFQTSACHCH